jgi:hypothetical protein
MYKNIGVLRTYLGHIVHDAVLDEERVHRASMQGMTEGEKGGVGAFYAPTPLCKAVRRKQALCLLRCQGPTLRRDAERTGVRGALAFSSALFLLCAFSLFSRSRF